MKERETYLESLYGDYLKQGYEETFAQIERGPDQHAVINDYLDFAAYLSENEYIDESITFLENGLKYAEKMENLPAQSVFLNNLATNLTSDPEESETAGLRKALEYARRATKIRENLPDRTIYVKALGQEGYCNYLLEDFEEALSLFNKAEKIARENDAGNELGWVLFHKVLCVIESGDDSIADEEVIAILEEAKDIFKNTDDQDGIDEINALLSELQE